MSRGAKRGRGLCGGGFSEQQGEAMVEGDEAGEGGGSGATDATDGDGNTWV